MGTHFKKSSANCAMQNLTLILVLPLALVLAAVVATPVERTNGVISTLYRGDFPLDGDQHFITVNRGCPGCKRRLLPYPYPIHLIGYDERRGLVKRSPQFKIFGKKTFKKTKKPGFNKPFKFGKKSFGKAKKPGTPQNKAKNFGKKFGKKNFAKAKKPGTPQNKKAKGKGKKGFNKTKKGGKKGGKKLGKGAKKSSPLTIPALGLGAPALGGGGLAFGVPGTGFAGFAIPGASQAAFDYVAG